MTVAAQPDKHWLKVGSCLAMGSDPLGKPSGQKRCQERMALPWLLWPPRPFLHLLGACRGMASDVQRVHKTP